VAVAVTTFAARLYSGSAQPAGYNVPSYHVGFEPMDPDVPQPKRQDKVLSGLNVAIETLNLAKEVSSITPAKAVFGSVSVIITMIRVGIFLCC